MSKNEFILTHHGMEIFRGTENGCYVRLQRSQSQSADWAMKYEGWKIEEVNPKLNFSKAWSDTDFANVKAAITVHFKGRTFDTHKGKVKFGNSFKAIDEVLGLAYTSSSSIAMYGICNIQIMADSEYHYNHFAVSELTGNVFAELWDKDENVKLIQLTK